VRPDIVDEHFIVCGLDGQELAEKFVGCDCDVCAARKAPSFRT
jgi:hypothetical protein